MPNNFPDYGVYSRKSHPLSLEQGKWHRESSADAPIPPSASDYGSEYDEAEEKNIYAREDWRAYGASAQPEENTHLLNKVKTFFGIGPKGYERRDDRILENLNEALLHDPRLDASNLDINFSGGIVTLEGSVPDRWSKWRAEDVSESILGVKGVNNFLAVDPHPVPHSEAPQETENTFGIVGMSGTTSTGGFNNSIVVPPPSEL